MAPPSTIRGTQLYIKVGDGESPETFAHPCLINTQRGIQFTSNGQNIAIPDCAAPDDPAWTEHEKSDLTATITGAGILDTAAIAEYDAWFRSNDAKNVQVWVNTFGHWPGAFKLTDFQVTGDRGGGKAEVSLTLTSHGEVEAFVPA